METIRDPLDALRRTLDTFRITECRVSHERVVFDRGAALRRHANGVETSFVRVGLCDWSDREVQLACAHTTARHRLVSAAEALARQGLLSKDEALEIAGRIMQLADIIHAADWSKGELEATYALAFESGAEPKAQSLRADIQRLESDHTTASRELHTILEWLRRAAGAADNPV